jgi:hypothetical protein
MKEDTTLQAVLSLSMFSHHVGSQERLRKYMSNKFSVKRLNRLGPIAGHTNVVELSRFVSTL